MVWICISKVTGRVHSAYCNCTAGPGESCNHIAALLYALVDISEKKRRGELASTSQACKWNMPRKRKLSPKKSSEMKVQKFEWKKTKRAPATATKTLPLHPVLDVTKFRQNLAECYPLAGWLKNFPPEKTDEKENRQLPPLHTIEFMYGDHIDLASSDCVEYFEEYFNNLSTSAELLKDIEEATRGQSTNDHWMECRTGRLTSSMFGTIVRRQDDTPPDNLIKALLGYVPTCQTSAMKWGSEHECIARDSYVSFQQNSHPSLSVRECGLIVSSEHPHLGASPDGLVYCPHCPQYNGILEIKCPYRDRHLTPAEAAMNKSFCCVLTKTGALKLKTNHAYYYQVQGQLGLTGRKWCDFVVWTTRGMTIQRIYFDANLWKNTMLPKLEAFYKHGVIPELFSMRVKRHRKLYF